jgi:hypothetical protein
MSVIIKSSKYMLKCSNMLCKQTIAFIKTTYALTIVEYYVIIIVGNREIWSSKGKQPYNLQSNVLVVLSSLSSLPCSITSDRRRVLQEPEDRTASDSSTLPG